MDEPWVLPPLDSTVGLFFAEGFRAHGLNLPNTTVVAYAYEVRVSLLATNRYLTILPESFCDFRQRIHASGRCPLSCRCDACLSVSSP